MTIAHPLRIAGWAVVAAILLAPLVAMRFTDRVAWGAGDFATAALLLGGTGVVLEIVARRASSEALIAAVAAALATALALVWATLAVGIAGPEGHPANGVVFVILGVAALVELGSLYARGRPGTMALAMAATAVAQIACGAVSGIAGPGIPAIGTFGFAALWLVAAALFARADQRSRIP
jgi:hypothetical protein